MLIVLIVYLMLAVVGVGAVIVLSIRDTRYHKEIRDAFRKMRDAERKNIVTDDRGRVGADRSPEKRIKEELWKNYL